MKNRFRIMPKYSIFPIVILAFVFAFAYYGTKAITYNAVHTDVRTAVDGMIPLWAPSVLVYFLAYVQWVVCMFVFAWQKKELCYRLFCSEMMGKIPAIIIFLVMPTMMFARPEVTGTGFFDYFLRFIYAADTPVNLFPSLHCLESWICARGIFLCPGVPKWVKWSNLVFSVLVFASTVLTKQHLILDIPGGILCAEIGLLAARYLTPVRFLDLPLKFARKKEGAR